MENAVLLKAIVDNAIDGLITIHDRGKIESINPSACKLFEYTEEDVFGNNISVLMPNTDARKHDDYLTRRIGAELTVSMQETVKILQQTKDESSLSLTKRKGTGKIEKYGCSHCVPRVLYTQFSTAFPLPCRTSYNSVSSKYTELMSGHVNFRSRIARGTLSTFTFPTKSRRK